MILACDQCSRQYRVDKYPPGQRVRCLCGHCLVVPEPRTHAARILHCADCGGPLPSDAAKCDYCGGVLDPQQQSFTLVCPRCFARLPATARFCIECAVAIRPQEVVERQGSSRRCPRCQVPLQSRVAEAVPFDECPSCLGLWLSSEAFKAVCQQQVEAFTVNPLPSAVRAQPSLAPVTYIKCPECGNVMNRQNYGRVSGVLIDQCRDHGIWLDDAELERIARFIAEGGLARARRAEAETVEQQARSAQRQVGAASVGHGAPDVVDAWGALTFLSVLGGLLE